MAPTNGGRTMGASSKPVSVVLPAKLYRSPSHANGIASTKAAVVLPTANRKAFHKPST